MKEKLCELTVDQFVELMCGSLAVLYPKKAIPNIEKATAVAKNIMMEYQEITDSAGVKRYLADLEDIIHGNYAMLFYAICTRLMDSGKVAEVRDLLEEYGLNPTKWSDGRLSAELKSRYEKANNTIARVRETMASGNRKVDFRKEFDTQTAALMAYFKFQIDTSVMKANIYARLVERCAAEHKARLAAMKKT